MTKIIMAAVLVFGFSTAYAEDNSGTDLQTMQNMFQKKLKRKCRMTSVRLAQSHTVSQWEKIQEEGKMDEEIFRICPRFPKDLLSPEQFEAFKGYIIQYGLGSKLKAPEC